MQGSPPSERRVLEAGGAPDPGENHAVMPPGWSWTRGVLLSARILGCAPGCASDVRRPQLAPPPSDGGADASGLLAYDEFIGIDWNWLAMDGAMTKAPRGGK